MNVDYTLELTEDEFVDLDDILPDHSDPSHPLYKLNRILTAARQTQRDSGYCLDVTVTIWIVKE